MDAQPLGRWPTNVILTDPIFDGGVEGVVGGGEAPSAKPYVRNVPGESMFLPRPMGEDVVNGYGDKGTYSRFFQIPRNRVMDAPWQHKHRADP